MAFDVVEYAQAIDEFIIRMEKIRELIHPDIHSAMGRLCRVLRIAQVEAVFYEILENEEKKWGGRAIFYREGIWDSERPMLCKEQKEDGNLIEYVLYPIEGEADWDQEEQERIQIFIKLLYTFNRRVQVMNLMEQLSYRDQESGMYNFAYFKRELTQRISEGSIGKYGACSFNLKHFSVINQQIGRAQGSRVMGKFIRGLQAKLGAEELVCRNGGDNFLVLFFKTNLKLVMDYLKGTGIVYDEKEKKRVFITAYAGYYMIPGSCKSIGSIMDRLNTALNMAKNVRKTEYVFFDEELMQGVRVGKMIETILPDALQKEEFQVYYQPKILLKDYRLVGAEALCRWFQNGRIMAPGEFVPILEQSRLICMLDFYMLEHVCQDIRRWLDEGRKVVKISVNLSRCHMGDVDLLENILAIVDKYQVPHEYIEIELTETGTEVDFKDLKKLVSGLREQGISTSVDDFGTGYSSINLIRELPWNVIKIDKSFLQGKSEEDAHKRVMIKHLIALAKDMEMDCIVEGVETVEQVQLLKENNCYLAQGFYFDKPLPVKEFEEKLLEIM